MKTSVDFDVARRELIDQITALGRTLPGSLVSRSSSCRNRDCRCDSDAGQRHGPYWTWTRSLGCTAITRALTDEKAERYRFRFANARRLHVLVDALKELAMEQVETDDRWPAS